MSIQVYKASAKGLSKPTGMQATDRMVFTDSSTALCYDATNNTVIEPFMRKSKDSHVELTNEEFPKLTVPPAVWRMYSGHADKLQALADKFGFTIQKE